MSKIVCKWIEEDEQILVNPDGQILPCCYLSGYFKIAATQPTTQDKWDKVKDQLYHRSLVDKHVRNHYLYKEYDKRKDELNIFKNDLEDILNNEWFTKILPESWESRETIAGPCYRICTNKSKGNIDIDTL